MSRDRAYFLLRKLHSLTGIVPAGVFLLSHCLINSGALLGERAFTDGVRTVNSLPYLPYIEIGGIMIPLAFHGVIGLYMVFVQASYNNGSYNYSRNWWYLFQRITGVLVFAFLCWHLWDTWIAKELGQIRLEEFYRHLGAGMSGELVYRAIFIVGTLAVSVHLANGIWGFCASWGIFQSRRAQRLASWAFAVFGVLFFAVWLNIIYHFTTGGSNIIPVQENPYEYTEQFAQGDQ